MILMDNQQAYQKIKHKLSDPRWRINNLYYITDKSGNRVKFKMNWAQEELYNNLHYFNVILKARQLGFTTFVMIYYLDACLFNSHHSAGVIAHTVVDAKKLFKKKIKFAYDNLPEWLKEVRPAKSDAAGLLEFNNGSSVYVGTSLRSDTLQKLLVSEYGKIGAKYPEKATEIKTGALNTVESGQQIIVESTAEGKTGEYYDLYQRATRLADSPDALAMMQPKSFFFGWWKNPSYTTDEVVTITEEMEKYFRELGDQGINLTQGQKYWYVLKSEQQGDEMQQEYPSTPEEAFQGSMKGAFYTKEMKKVRERGQITTIPYNPKYQVYTWWDLGLNDQMSVWFYQKIDGKHLFIDYHESTSEGWEYYATMLRDKGYNYACHNLPHDGNKRVRGAQIFTDRTMAEQCGIRPIKVTPVTSSTYNDIINHCVPVLPNCWFDASKCAVGITHLDNYKKKWSKPDGMFMKEPLHDESSHGADAFRTFAVNADNIEGDDDDDQHIDPFAYIGGRGYGG